MNEGLYLNLGSGQRPFAAPWINVDAQARFEPHLVFDLRKSWPWQDESAECIVFHHCWEHESDEAVLHFQSEAFRVLKPGGSLIICVPDMRALAQAWLMGKMTTQLYMTNVYGAYMGDEHDRHRRGYDFMYLFSELQWKPWRGVRGFDGRKIEGADIAIDWWILIMEAVR
jgi:predicted SAM-dependent methyltransferase